MTEPDRAGLQGADFEELVREVEARMQGALDQQARLRLLLDAVVTMAADLTLDGVLSRIVAIASRLADARYAALGVLGDADEQPLRTFIHHGISADVAVEIGDLPRGHGLLGLIIDRPEPLRLHDIAEHPESYGFPPNHPPMHSFLGVPVRIRDRVFGNLYLTEKRDGTDFTAEDEEIVIALAAAAGVTIENARLYEEAQQAREDRERLLVLEDRDRIGRDLHDLIIQRLFAVGLGLQSSSRLVAQPEVSKRLEQAVDDIDATIKDIRRTIFALGAPDLSDDVQAEVTRLVDRAAATLKFRPELSFIGPVRTLINEDLVPDLLAVLGEALSNAARHAFASSGAVVVSAGDEIVLTVIDDGRAMPPDIVESGLANIRRRAEQRGGTFSVESSPGEGTTLRWAVPRV
ncbi:GAF domain-containing protein [Nocardioides humilatus]|uniref:GAF domain-containing protein n=1 Tax=Nocardioides humilatus TaxID=2607660 RepID=A0A5B1LDD3_9ACTN|nr:GAF domain-containing sensor histidine kinase [Nocardioides humilatus]KAA1417810.1 GAF domain-containing protein [Nocardioides humilatus]